MSTEALPGASSPAAVSPAAPLLLSPGAALRREAFGGLVYTYDDRRLYFLHSKPLVDFLETLDGAAPVGAALDRFVAERGLAPASRGAFLEALGRLRALDVVRAPGDGRPEGGRAPKAKAPDARKGTASSRSSKETFRQGLRSPICLTWELTYGCNLRCAHCLSSSGDARSEELTTAEAKRLVDEWAAMDVFYVNVGGGEPMSRPDFFELMDYCMDSGVGVKFSTNGTLIDDRAADWIASRAGMLDVQISIDGASAATSDPLRGNGSFLRARRGMERLAARGFRFKINTVATRQNVDELDDLYAIARGYDAELRLTRLRPSGRGRDVWEAAKPTHEQNRVIYDWLHAHPDVLTGDSFFHLSAYGEALDGMNLCGAGRIVCCVDPVGDVYACPFVLDDAFAAGNVRGEGGFTGLWRGSPLFAHLREWQVGGSCQTCNAYSACHGGCMAVKHFTGRSLDDPDPDCVFGHGEVPAGEPRRVSLPIAAASAAGA